MAVVQDLKGTVFELKSQLAMADAEIVNLKKQLQQADGSGAGGMVEAAMAPKTLTFGRAAAWGGGAEVSGPSTRVR